MTANPSMQQLRMKSIKRNLNGLVLKHFVLTQTQEAEKAIIGCGEYQIREKYQHLTIPIAKWNRMNEEQRKRCIHKFNSAKVQNVVPVHHPDPAPVQSDSNSISGLSMPFDDVKGKSSIPENCLEGIWKKAARLVSQQNVIVQAPGPKSKDRLVISESTKCPHYISVVDSDYQCDQTCCNYNSMYLCSHVVAAAEVTMICNSLWIYF